MTVSESSIRNRVTRPSDAALPPLSGESNSLPPLALRASEAARVLGIGTRQLWTLTNAGKIPHVRIGRTILYPVTSLNEWLCRSAKGGK